MKDNRFYFSFVFVVAFIVIVAGNSFGNESKFSDYNKDNRYKRDIVVNTLEFSDFKTNLLMEFPEKIRIDTSKNYTIYYDDYEKDFFISKDKYKVSVKELIDVYENYWLEYEKNER